MLPEPARTSNRTPAKGWFLLIRDGELLETNDKGWKKEGSVYVMWGETKDNCLRNLGCYARDKGPNFLKQVSPSKFNHECNFGQYPDGSYVLIDASSLSMPLPLGTMGEEDPDVTLTDPYTCHCGKRVEEAAIIMGKWCWCTTRCFVAHPPEGWAKIDSAVVRTLRRTELALENTMNSNDALKVARSELCQQLDQVGRQVSTLVQERDQALSGAEGDNRAFESVLKEARKKKKEAKELKIRVAELELLVEVLDQTIPIGECKRPCMTSTGICGNLTHGWGELDANGYWEHPCDSEAHVPKNDIYNSFPSQNPTKEPTVTDTPLHNSHDNLPSAQKLAKQLKNRTCGVCKKALANAQGVKHHQRMTDCGAVMAEAYEQAETPSPFGSHARVTIESEKVQLAQINYKRQVALATITGELIQVGIKYGSIAAAIIGSVYHLV